MRPPASRSPSGVRGRQDLANHKHTHDRRTRVFQRTAEKQGNAGARVGGDPQEVRKGFLEEVAFTPPREGLGRSLGREKSWCKGPEVRLISVLGEQTPFSPKY